MILQDFTEWLLNLVILLALNKKQKTSIESNTKAKESTSVLEKQTKQMSINDECDINDEQICSENKTETVVLKNTINFENNIDELEVDLVVDSKTAAVRIGDSPSFVAIVEKILKSVKVKWIFWIYQC